MKDNDKIFELIVKERTQELSPEEITALHDWKNREVKNLLQYNKLVKLWEDAGSIQYVTSKEMVNDWQVIQKRIQPNKTQVWYWAAASIILLLGFFLIYQFNQDPLSNYAYYEAGQEIQVITLADGSKITLNKGAELWVSNKFDQTDRQSRLNGEAFFEVAKNPSKPFTVQSGNAIIRVLGTSFNVRSTKKAKLLDVVEGRVAFGGDHQQLTVAANQSARYSNDGNLEFISSGPNVLSWKTGILIFKSTPLKQVFEDISHTYQVEITLSDDVDLDKPFTSEFYDSTLDKILEILSLTHQLKYTKEGTKYNITQQ